MSRRTALLLVTALIPIGSAGALQAPQPFVIDKDADPRAASVVRDAMALTGRYFRESFGVSLPRPVHVRIAGSESCPGSRATGGATDTTLCIWTGGKTWPRLMARPTDALSLVAHEHVHNFQGQLGCLPASPREYRWLTEGMAVHLSWRALIHSDMATAADYSAWLDRLSAQPGRVQRLSAYADSVRDGDRAYAHVTRAVQLLAAKGGGDASLVHFCQSATPDWRASFEAAFGESPAVFMERFDSENASLPDQT